MGRKKRNSNNPARRRRAFRRLTPRVATTVALDFSCYRIQFTALVTTNGAGFLSAVVPFTMGSYQDFTAIAGLWDEYRVMRGTVAYYNVIPLGNATVANGMIGMCFDNDDNVALTTVSQGLAYQQKVTFNALKNVKTIFNWHRTAGQNSPSTDWQNTASPSLVGSVKFFSIALTATQAYGSYVCDLFCSVRGRR